MLKIIGGEARGRTINTPRGNAYVRPILARIKKSLFDILRLRLPGSRFLDVYAGSGAVGLEALSRGASSAVFLERDFKCVETIHLNLNKLNWEARGSVFRVDAIRDLSLVPGPFDIVFLGPPYVDEMKNPLALVNPTLENIARHGLLKKEGILIAQHHKKEPVSVPPSFGDVYRVEQYGDTVLTFIKDLNPNALA